MTTAGNNHLKEKNPQGVKSTTQSNETSDRLDESCDNNKSTEVKGRKKKRERANVETTDGAHLGVEGRDIKEREKDGKGTVEEKSGGDDQNL